MKMKCPFMTYVDPISKTAVTKPCMEEDCAIYCDPLKMCGFLMGMCFSEKGKEAVIVDFLTNENNC